MTLWFEDLEVGRSWTSPTRTITEADIGDFAGLTGDRFPLHTSETFAARSPYGTRIAHGLLGLAFAHGLMWARTGELDESVLAFLGLREWAFTGAIRIGDTIGVRYRVADRRTSRSKPGRGVVEFAVEVHNQHEELVSHGYKTMLIATRPDTNEETRT